MQKQNDNLEIEKLRQSQRQLQEQILKLQQDKIFKEHLKSLPVTDMLLKQQIEDLKIKLNEMT